MISHTHRCIFIHIPRTAGSSVEEWIFGEDWWNHSPSTKHLTAHTARQLYAEYWDDYFTFSFVRNPWDRMLSCLHFGAHFGIATTGGKLDFTGYEQKFGSPVTLELDHRFHNRADVLGAQHRPGAVYGNLLDEELDFIGKFETLDADIAHVAETLGIEAPFTSRLKARSERPSTGQAYDSSADSWIRTAFSNDLKRFDYHQPSG